LAELEDDYWYQIVTLVPRKVGSEWIEIFFDNIAETAYDMQTHYDSQNQGRDWDIFVAGGPEKDYYREEHAKIAKLEKEVESLKTELRRERDAILRSHSEDPDW